MIGLEIRESFRFYFSVNTRMRRILLDMIIALSKSMRSISDRRRKPTTAKSQALEIRVIFGVVCSAVL